MSQIKGFLAGGVILLTILGAASFSTPHTFPNPPSQTSQGDSGQTMQALLSEVHQLRLAISTLQSQHQPRTSHT
jgi:hypothetical protein